MRPLNTQYLSFHKKKQRAKIKNSTNFCKRSVSQPFKPDVMKTKILFSFKFCKALNC